MEFLLSLERRSEGRLSVRLLLDDADRAAAASEAPGEALELFQPTWTPGSYLIRDYSRFVDRVVDDAGRPLQKVGKNRWVLPAGCREIRYSVYGAEWSVRNAWIDNDFALWNGASVLLWPRRLEDRAAELAVDLPAGWDLFVQRPAVRDGDRAAFSVDALHQAIDTPCLAAHEDETRLVGFEVDGVEHRFVAVGMGAVPLPDTLADEARAVVEESRAVFAGPGRLPYESYDFLTLCGSNGRGGLEHDACSVLIHPRTGFRGKEYEDFLGLVAHEHFHVWNVRRMRPEGLVEPDFESEVDTSDLWLSEGFTAYYDDLICRRAGILSQARYLEILSGNWSTVLQTPGRFAQSLCEAAADAWIRLYRPHANLRNVTQNYYVHGAVAAACLDAHVRLASGNERELDDVLRALWARSHAVGRAFTREDVVASFDEAVGAAPVAVGSVDEVDGWGGLIQALVDGPFDPDVEGLFRAAYGLSTVVRPPARSSLGIQIRSGTTVIAYVRDGEPGRAAGLMPEDELIAVDGLRLDPTSWNHVFEAVLRDGQEAEILYSRQGRLRNTTVVPDRSGVRDVRFEILEDATDEQVARRCRWLDRRNGTAD